MQCAHCGFACTADGHNMTKATFRNVLKLVGKGSEESLITIGGGEPTLHPLLFDFIWMGVRATLHTAYDSGFAGVGIVTNGKKTESAIELAMLARQGIISARLSVDDYHEEIDEKVRKAFKPYLHDTKDLRGLNTRGLVIPAGRAESWGDHPYTKCFCEEPIIDPLGVIWQCGHKEVSLGNVNDPSDQSRISAFMQEGRCSRKPLTA
jgi:hypothetical protein